MADPILRDWRLTDVASLARHANNIHVWNNLRDGFPYPYTERDAELFIQMVTRKPRPSVDKAIEVDGEAVGSIGITLHDGVERVSAEIGFFIGEAYWNRGITTEAIKQMSAYAFAHFPIERLYASVFDFNIASQRVLRKAGFVREAVLPRAAIKNGVVVDWLYFARYR
ncbi:MAG: GNAT family N-acetyltransferase [Mediterranea sp.]|jgi:RimJ/RimL family protein N-acetyltransferase|nr:GNAT family N-acetyltransferase [Mediterranea sp.]